jgi:hypothetical protein
VDHITIFLVVQLSIRSLLQQREKSTGELIYVEARLQDVSVQEMKVADEKEQSIQATGCGVAEPLEMCVLVDGIAIPCEHNQEYGSSKFDIAREKKQPVSVKGCGTKKGIEIAVDVSGLSTVEEKETEFVFSELNTIKEYEQFVPLGQLNVAGEDSHSISVTPLLTKKGKKAKIKDLLDLYESLDETD